MGTERLSLSLQKREESLQRQTDAFLRIRCFRIELFDDLILSFFTTVSLLRAKRQARRPQERAQVHSHSFQSISLLMVSPSIDIKRLCYEN